MSSSIVLFNGVRIDDSPPGRVRRYRNLSPGAWGAARLLLYMHRSFPRVWANRSAAQGRQDANNPSFRYATSVWIARLERMPKTSGTWKELARFISDPGLNRQDVTDIAKAIIELAVRDAEIERNSYRNDPRPIAPVWSNGSSNTEHVQAEQRLMGRVRRAVASNHREVEKLIYQSLAAHDATVVHRIAQTAPTHHPVFQALSRL